MSKIAALSAQVPVRHMPAPARAPVATPAARVEPHEAGKPIFLPPQVQAFAAQALSALIDLQARSAEPQGAQGDDGDLGHRAPPPPVSSDPQPDHGRDDDHGHKPPVQDPPPVVQPPAPQPPAVAPAPYDPAAPQRTIAMISARLADEAIQDQARAAFAAQRAEERASVVVAQGQAALAIFQNMQRSYEAWRAAPTHGISRAA